MLESTRLKIRKTFAYMGPALCAIFALAVTMTGCGSGSSDGSTPAKYFRYVKEGNVKDGEYIVIKGLNTASDKKGNLKVNLDDIWKKYQGKIVIPTKIDGLPVREVKISPISEDADLFEGTNVYILNVLDNEKMFYASDKEYNKLITEVVIPEGSFIESWDNYCWNDVQTVTVPLSLFNAHFSNSCQNIIITQGNCNDDKIKPMLLFYKKMTLPECVKKIDLYAFTQVEEIHCASDAVFFYDGKGSSNSPQETIQKANLDPYRDDREIEHFKKQTINGKKVIE